MEDIAMQLFKLGDQERKGFIVKRDMQVSTLDIWQVIFVITKWYFNSNPSRFCNLNDLLNNFYYIKKI